MKYEILATGRFKKDLKAIESVILLPIGFWFTRLITIFWF